eukprot:g3083.t1
MERRVDPSSGEAYTEQEFVDYYGGRVEWEAAIRMDAFPQNSASQEPVVELKSSDSTKKIEKVKAKEKRPPSVQVTSKSGGTFQEGNVRRVTKDSVPSPVASPQRSRDALGSFFPRRQPLFPQVESDLFSGGKAPEWLDMVKAREKAGCDYIKEHDLESIIAEKIQNVISGDFLPENPYLYIVKQFRMVEIQITTQGKVLATSDEVAEQKVLDTIRAAIQKDVVLSAEKERVYHMKGKSFLWGMNHVVRIIDEVAQKELIDLLEKGPASLIKMSQEFVVTAPKKKKKKELGPSVIVCTSLHGPTALHGLLWRTRTIELHHEYIVTASRFGQAADVFAKALREEFAVACKEEDVWVDCFKVWFKNGHKRWTHELLNATKRSRTRFEKDVKNAALKKHSVWMEALYIIRDSNERISDESFDDSWNKNSLEKLESRKRAQAGRGNPRVLRVKKKYSLHFISGDIDGNRDTPVSFCETPMDTYALGIFHTKASAASFAEVVGYPDSLQETDESYSHAHAETGDYSWPPESERVDRLFPVILRLMKTTLQRSERGDIYGAYESLLQLSMVRRDEDTLLDVAQMSASDAAYVFDLIGLNENIQEMALYLLDKHRTAAEKEKAEEIAEKAAAAKRAKKTGVSKRRLKAIKAAEEKAAEKKRIKEEYKASPEGILGELFEREAFLELQFQEYRMSLLSFVSTSRSSVAMDLRTFIDAKMLSLVHPVTRRLVVDKSAVEKLRDLNACARAIALCIASDIASVSLHAKDILDGLPLELMRLEVEYEERLERKVKKKKKSKSKSKKKKKEKSQSAKAKARAAGREAKLAAIKREMLKFDSQNRVIDVKRAVEQAVKRDAYPEEVIDEASILQYIVDTRLDVACSEIFVRIFTEALSSNPFAQLVQHFKNWALRFEVWHDLDSDVLKRKHSTKLVKSKKNEFVCCSFGGQGYVPLQNIEGLKSKERKRRHQEGSNLASNKSHVVFGTKSAVRLAEAEHVLRLKGVVVASTAKVKDLPVGGRVATAVVGEVGWWGTLSHPTCQEVPVVEVVEKLVLESTDVEACSQTFANHVVQSVIFIYRKNEYLALTLQVGEKSIEPVNVGRHRSSTIELIASAAKKREVVQLDALILLSSSNSEERLESSKNSKKKTKRSTKSKDNKQGAGTATDERYTLVRRNYTMRMLDVEDGKHRFHETWSQYEAICFDPQDAAEFIVPNEDPSSSERFKEYKASVRERIIAEVKEGDILPAYKQLLRLQMVRLPMANGKPTDDPYLPDISRMLSSMAERTHQMALGCKTISLVVRYQLTQRGEDANLVSQSAVIGQFEDLYDDAIRCMKTPEFMVALSGLQTVMAARLGSLRREIKAGLWAKKRTKKEEVDLSLVDSLEELEAQFTMISISLAARFHSNCPHIDEYFKVCRLSSTDGAHTFMEDEEEEKADGEEE